MIETNPFEGKTFDDPFLDRLLPLVQGLGKYNHYQVDGLDRVPTEGRLLIAVNHSFATYDSFLLGAAIYLNVRRKPYGLADHNFFKLRLVSELSERLGLVEGEHENAEKLLSRGELIMLAPGGMREAIRPKEQAFQIRWKNRKGFVRLAIRTQTPVMLAACPEADRLLDVYPNFLTPWVYKRLKLPFVYFKGVGLSPFPRPIQLTHYLSEILYPPPWDGNKNTLFALVQQFHRQIYRKMWQILNGTPLD